MDDFELKLISQAFDEEITLREKAENSLYEFLKQAWPSMEGTEPFSDGWHIQAICEHVEALYNGQIKNLLINVPPRSCKTNIISVAWPAWGWIKRSRSKFVFASYGSSLSREASSRCRWLIGSNWYQTRWGDRFSILKDYNTQSDFRNNQYGHRIATSIDGIGTGKGGDYLICDDPNNAKDGESEITKERTINWFCRTWPTRMNNRKTGAKLVVQQRLDEKDISGYILNNDKANDWVKLILPMEYEKSRSCKTIILPSTGKKIWQDPRKKEGELLWPNHIDAESLRTLKIELKTIYNVAGQLQQRPSPESGGIIKGNWLQIWKKEKPPELIQVIQSWDTAIEAGDENDYSACTTWGVFNDDKDIANLILLGLWRGKLEYPELRQMAQRLQKDYRNDGDSDIKPDGKHKPDFVMIEAKASGSSLAQDLTRAGISVIRFDPSRRGDKIARVRIASHILECGKVWIPARPPEYTALRSFSKALVEACVLFPNGDSRDIVDSMSQVLLRLIERKVLVNSSDYVPSEKRKKDNVYYWGA